MDADRERELLGLIEAYWRIARPGDVIETSEGSESSTSIVAYKSHVTVRPSQQHFIDTSKWRNFPASWAESESCLREVAGECAVRGLNFHIHRSTPTNPWQANIEKFHRHGIDIGYRTGDEDLSKPVALLQAFIKTLNPTKG